MGEGAAEEEPRGVVEGLAAASGAAPGVWEGLGRGSAGRRRTAGVVGTPRVCCGRPGCGAGVVLREQQRVAWSACVRIPCGSVSLVALRAKCRP